MSIRKCPYCLAVIPAVQVVAHSNDLDCPGCRRSLELSPVSRHMAAGSGLAAAAIVWQFAERSPVAAGTLGWLLPLAYSFLALSVVAPLVLMLTADLRLKSLVAPPEVNLLAAGANADERPSAHE